MIFQKGDDYPRRRSSSGGLLGLVRLFLSLVIMLILGLGLYQAYRSFSGFDPLKLDPQSLARNLFSSETAYQLLTRFLSFTPAGSFDAAKELLTKETSVSNQRKAGAPLQFRFAVVADSHKDVGSLAKALTQAKAAGAKFIIGMGDFSDVGTVDELVNTKRQFDAVGLPYYVTAGDHDLWDSRNQNRAAEDNFRSVFGAPYQSFSYQQARFILVFNSDNYHGLDTLQLEWLEDELVRSASSSPKPFFVFASTPLYHPSSDHIMGKKNPKLKDQAAHLLSLFQKNGVNEVFSSDTHFFSRYLDPVTSLPITTVGAVTSDRNLQSPRFAMVDVYEDGSYNVEETEVK